MIYKEKRKGSNLPLTYFTLCLLGVDITRVNISHINLDPKAKKKFIQDYLYWTLPITIDFR